MMLPVLPMLLGGALAAAPAVASNGAVSAPAAGEVGGPGLALRAAKILTCAWEGPQVVDRGVLLVRDGRIEAVGPARELEVPEGYEVVDLGQRWLAPGMVELHCHEAGYSLYSGVNDLNDMVYLVNPGLRASTAVKPGVRSMKMALAGGVTTVLYIPGSGTNIGGQGVLVKTGFDRYEESLVRDPGSMKLAQWGNPESWTIGVGMAVEHWGTRGTIRRGLSYAQRWHDFEQGVGPEPERNIELDIFRDLLAKRAQVSTHTQMYQVVLMTLTMVRGEFGLDVFLDHSTIGGWLAGAMAHSMGVPAIVGPRSIDPSSRRMLSWSRNKHEGMRGIAAGYQAAGHDMVGFNTDSPVIPQEELPLQAVMAVRYGFDDERAQAVRGLTIVPARAAGIDHRVGSLEPGKDADVLVTTGHPADPRTSTEIVFLEGRRVYDAQRDGRRW